MKGTLKHTKEGWVVEYCNYQDNCPSKGDYLKQYLCDIRQLLLHLDDAQKVELCFTEKATFKVEFEIVKDGRFFQTYKTSSFAKLIQPKEETMNPMFCEHANENPGKCNCPENCYCKSYTCKEKGAFEDGYAVTRVLSDEELERLEQEDNSNWDEIKKKFEEDTWVKGDDDTSFIFNWLKEHYLSPVKK
jgi:hypothetical protein